MSFIFVSGDKTQKTKKYQCETCHQIFENITLFKQHIVAKHRPLRRKSKTDESTKQLICISCNKSFKNNDKMINHFQGHGNPDRECKVCFRVLSSKSSLKNHGKTHSRRHPCKFCTKTFNKKIALEIHVAKNHKSNICNECNMVFNDLNELQDHLILHLPDSNVSELDLGEDFTSFVDEALKNPNIINKNIQHGCFFNDLMDIESEETIEECVKEEVVISKPMKSKVITDSISGSDEVSRVNERRHYKHKHNKVNFIFKLKLYNYV